MLISPAQAQVTAPAVPVGETATSSETAVPGAAPAGAVPDTGSILVQNIAMIVLLVVMFYFLLIRPQQKRFKEHKAMVDSLKVGDKVVAAGGLVGTIDSIVSDDEVIVDLGSGLKVTALRSMIQTRPEKTATAAGK